MAANGVCQRVDVDGIVVVGRRHPHRRLPAQAHQRAEGLVARRGRGGGGVLRIERHDQQALAALALQMLDPGGGGRIGVAHGPVHDDALIRQQRGQLLGLRARDGLERPLVALPVPDLVVVLALAAGADAQDDQVEDRPPLPARHLDDAPVGEELLEVAAHRPIVGAVGRAEVQEQHADAAALDGRVAVRQASLGGLTARHRSSRGRVGATDAHVGEAVPRHVRGPVDVAQIDDDGTLEQATSPAAGRGRGTHPTP